MIKCELGISANLKHANVFPIYGYTHASGLSTVIVSPWLENGNLTIYLEREGAALTRQTIPTGKSSLRISWVDDDAKGTFS